MFVKVERGNGWFHISTGVNFVINKDYTLFKEQVETYSYPVDGWYWVTTFEELQALPPIQDLLNEGLIQESDLAQQDLLNEGLIQESELNYYLNEDPFKNLS